MVCPDCSGRKDTPITHTFCTRCEVERLRRKCTDAEEAYSVIKDAYRELEEERDKWDRIASELYIALRWISRNADFIGTSNQEFYTRLKQLQNRADEAINDYYAIKDGRA